MSRPWASQRSRVTGPSCRQSSPGCLVALLDEMEKPMAPLFEPSSTLTAFSVTSRTRTPLVLTPVPG